MSIDFSLLIQIQGLDKRILVLRRRLESIPAEINVRESKLLLLRAELDDAESARKTAIAHASAVDTEVSSRDLRIKKLEKSILEMTVPSAVEVARNEIENLYNLNNKDQEEALDSLDQADHLAEKVKNIRENLSQQQKDFESFQVVAERDSESFQSELDNVLKQHQVVLKKINSAVVLVYQSLVDKYPGEVVACMNSDTCAGCGTRLVPNDCMRVEAMKSSFRCPSCGRFLVSQDFWSAQN